MDFTEEWFPIVDEEGNEISRAPRSVCHDGKSMLLHPVVHLHLFNKQGKLYLQKRAISKDLLPGYWDSSVGGHVAPGEGIEEALKREALEELGLSDLKVEFKRKYIWVSKRERELVYSFTGHTENVPEINKDEIEEGRFWTLAEIKKSLGTDIFTPNFEHEFQFLFCGDK
jgi:isopentenyldiphosphate isomerase